MVYLLFKLVQYFIEIFQMYTIVMKVRTTLSKLPEIQRSVILITNNREVIIMQKERKNHALKINSMDCDAGNACEPISGNSVRNTGFRQ